MPRKTRTPESLALNRENQRRSRARQRELVDELQTRVREYERRDGQATLEMQRVARAVAGENAALRGLLAAKGVLAEEVEAHVEAVKREERAVVRTGVSSVTPASTPSCTASPVEVVSKPMLYPQPQPQAYGPVRENSNPPFSFQPKMYSPPTPATTATSCTEESGKEDEDGIQQTDKRPGGNDAQEDSLIPLGSDHLAQGEASNDGCCERDAEKDCHTGGDSRVRHIKRALLSTDDPDEEDGHGRVESHLQDRVYSHEDSTVLAVATSEAVPDQYHGDAPCKTY
ncbi:hypothetical protein HG530_003753 [Fusarium avenaceum]|nr:hypothetical protein HG530_003753 [Fusarium avenaceum]